MWGECRVPGRLQNPPRAWAPGPAYWAGAPTEPAAHWTEVHWVRAMRPGFLLSLLALLSYQCDSVFTDKETERKRTGNSRGPWPETSCRLGLRRSVCFPRPVLAASCRVSSPRGLARESQTEPPAAWKGNEIAGSLTAVSEPALAAGGHVSPLPPAMSA